MATERVKLGNLLDEASGIVKRVTALEYAIKYLKTSTDRLSSETFLYDGKGTRLGLAIPKRILIAQARLELRSRKEALGDLRKQIASVGGL